MSSVHSLKPAIILSAIFAAIFPAGAAQTSWNHTGSGAWNIGSNWTAGVPTGSVDAIFDDGGTGLLPAGVSGNYGSLTIGSVDGGAGSLVISGGTLRGSQASIGSVAGSTGSVIMSSGSWTTSGDLLVGDYGAGSLVLNGGAITAGTLYLGTHTYGPGSGSTVTVNGGTLTTTAGDSFLGLNGGSLQITGGTVNMAGITRASAYGTPTTTTITGGAWNLGSLIMTGGDQAITVTIGGGVVTATSSIILSKNGVVNLNAGGTLQLGGGADALSAQSPLSTVNFSGGTVRAINFPLRITAPLNLTGTTTIDTNSLDTTIAGSIDADGNATPGKMTGPGGFTKVGAGTLTLTGTATYSGGTTVSAGTLRGTTSSLQGNIADRAEVAFDQTTDGTFSGAISGTGSLTKSGVGTVTLPAQSYIGSTLIEGGTLVATDSLASSSVDVMSSGTLGGSATVAGMVSVENGGRLAPGAGPGTMAMNSLELGSGAFLDFELGTPGIVGRGVNDLINISGHLTLAGTLNITALSGFGEGSYTLLTYGGTLANDGLLLGVTPSGFDYRIDSATSGAIELTVAATNLQYWNGMTTNPDGTVHGGDGTWAAGTTNWTGANGISSSSWGGSTAVFAGIGGAVTVSGTQAIEGIQFISDEYVITGGALDIGTGAELKADDADTIASTITGTGGITIAGAGTITLNGNSTYLGGTTLESGQLVIDGDAALGAGSGDLTIQHGVLFTSEDMTLARNLVFDNADGTIRVAGGTTLTLSGELSGFGGLLKTEDGTLEISGTGNLNHNVTVEGGELLITGTLSNTASAIGAADGLDGMVEVNGPGAVWTVANLNSVGDTGLGILEILDGGRVENYFGYIGTVAGSLGDALVSGPGSEWQSIGYFIVGGEGKGEITVEDGGDVSNFAGVLGNSAGGNGLVTMSDGTWSSTDHLTIGYAGDGVLTQNDGEITAPDVVVADLPGSTGILDLNGGQLITGKVEAHDGTAALNFNGGRLVATGDEADFISNFPDGQVVLEGDGGTIDNGGHTITVASPLTGTGNLTVQGRGTLTLGGSSTYTGSTTVSAGKLVVDGSIADSVLTTVESGATLGGNGTVGAVTIASGGTILPGDPIGVLHTGNEIWNGGGGYVWSLNNASDSSDARGTTYDWLNITGTLDLTAVTSGSPFTITILSLTAGDFSGLTPGFAFGQTYHWTIATANGGISGFSADKFAFDTSGFQAPSGAVSPFVISQVGNDLVLTYTSVPEPSTWALIGLGLFGIIFRHHRKRRIGPGIRA